MWVFNCPGYYFGPASLQDAAYTMLNFASTLRSLSVRYVCPFRI